MTAALKHRWFSFSLRTLFVVVTVCGTAGYWVHRQIANERASREYETAFAAWEAEAATTADVCQASLRLFNAAAGVPFANRRNAAAAHLARLARIKRTVYDMTEQGVYGDPDAPERNRTEIDDYFAEAERLASQP